MMKTAVWGSETPMAMRFEVWQVCSLKFPVVERQSIVAYIPLVTGHTLCYPELQCIYRSYLLRGLEYVSRTYVDLYGSSGLGRPTCSPSVPEVDHAVFDANNTLDYQARDRCLSCLREAPRHVI